MRRWAPVLGFLACAVAGRGAEAQSGPRLYASPSSIRIVLTEGSGAPATGSTGINCAGTGCPLTVYGSVSSTWMRLLSGGGPTPEPFGVGAIGASTMAAGHYYATLSVRGSSYPYSASVSVPIYLEILRRSQPELLVNQDFDQGITPWRPTGAATLATSGCMGAGCVTLGGANGAVGSVEQTVTAPPCCGDIFVKLQAKRTKPPPPPGIQPPSNDVLEIELRDTSGNLLSALATLRESDLDGGWQATRIWRVPYLRGRTARLVFRAVCDGALPTTFWIDDVSLS